VAQLAIFAIVEKNMYNMNEDRAETHRVVGYQ
jgi:hypothetical protein